MEKQSALIPLVVGVAGHRDISGETKQKLFATARELFRNLQNRYPATPVHVLSSLAAGADMACAHAALDAGCPLIVPLPMPAEEYRADFSQEEAAEFDALLARASRVFIAPSSEQSNAPERGFYYRQAEIYMVGHSHLLLACWDGEETLAAGGGGTYETICLMREQPRPNAEDAEFSHDGGLVLRVSTPRENAPLPENPFHLTLMDGPYSKTLESPDFPQAEFSCIEAFNRDTTKYETVLQNAARHSKDDCVSPTAQAVLDEDEKKLLQIYAAADSLAVHFQKRRILALRLLALLGLLFVLFFLFYDELQSPPMLIGYGALIVIAAACYLFFTRKRFHDKYVLYRLLAEAARIQLYAEIANLRAFVFHIPWWKQTTGLRFVEDTCRILRKTQWQSPGLPTAAMLKECWVDTQLHYHKRAIAKKGGKAAWNKRLAQALLAAAILIFVVVAIIEAAVPWVMKQEIPNILSGVFPFLQYTLAWNALFKIILGAVSAAAAFLANYYGKLALAEQVRGSERMYRLYTESGEKLGAALQSGDTRAACRILLLLANTAAEENLDWYTYSTDNTPEFFIG